MRCAIWYHLYNLNNGENTHGGVLLLVKLQASACNFTKNNTLPWVFFTLLKLYEWYQIAQSATYYFFGYFIALLFIFKSGTPYFFLYRESLLKWIILWKSFNKCSIPNSQKKIQETTATKAFAPLLVRCFSMRPLFEQIFSHYVLEPWWNIKPFEQVRVN